MPWRGPEHPDDFPSLGWALLDWWSDVLPSPTDADEPYVLTDEMALQVVEWYALDPETGRFVYRRGASRRSKGWGKSPLEAAKAIAELAGDVVFDGWDADGEPVGRPWGTRGLPAPWVQIAAVSEDQTENTYGALYEFLNANDGKAADRLGIDHGLTRCYLRNKPGKLEPVTASAGTREGQRVTYAVLDETHLWTPRNGGVKLARTLRRNVAKMSGRSYETTNSFAPGEGSVAEGTHKAIDKGAPGVYYDAVEAPAVKPEDSDEKLEAALKIAYGGSYWVDLRRLVHEVRDPETPWEDALRFYFNHNADDRRKAIDRKLWKTLFDADAMPPAGARIGLGFDGSLSDDTTALIGCWWTGTKWHVFEIEIWSRPPNAKPGWRVPRREIRDRVTECFAYWRVGLMLADPAKWQTEIEFWAEEHGEDVVLFFDTNQPTRMWKACDRYSTAVEQATEFSWSGTTHGEHVLAMYKRKVRVRDEDDKEDGRTKYVFVKGPDREKIDGGIGSVLALEAAQTMPPDDRPPPPATANSAPDTGGVNIFRPSQRLKL